MCIDLTKANDRCFEGLISKSKELGWKKAKGKANSIDIQNQKIEIKRRISDSEILGGKEMKD